MTDTKIKKGNRKKQGEKSEEINTDLDFDSLEPTNAGGERPKAEIKADESQNINTELDLDSLDITRSEPPQKSDEDSAIDKQLSEKYKNKKKEDTGGVLITKNAEKAQKTIKTISTELLPKDSIEDENFSDGSEGKDGTASELNLSPQGLDQFSEYSSSEGEKNILEDTFSKRHTENEKSAVKNEKTGNGSDLFLESQKINSEASFASEEKTLPISGAQTEEDNDATFVDTTAPQAKLIVRTGHLKKKVFPITNQKLILGRSIDSDITVPDPRASRNHAQIYFRDGCFMIEDMGSANGIRVNGEKVEQYVLKSQDKIAIGNTVLEFVLVDPNQFNEPDEKSIVLDYDPGAKTVVGTTLQKGAEGKTSLRQSAKTEVIGGNASSFTMGKTYTSGQSQILGETAFNTKHTNEVKSKFSLKPDEKKTSAQKRKILLIVLLLLLLLGGVYFLFFDNSGTTQTQKPAAPVATQENLAANNPTGLSETDQQLAISYYNKAKEYYEQEQFENAITEAKRAVQVYPNFTQAKELIDYANQAITDQQTKQGEQQSKLEQDRKLSQMEDYLNQADALLNKKKFYEAMIPINKVLNIDPNHEEALAMKEEAQNGIQAIKKVASKRSKLKQNMTRRYEEAEKFFNDGKYLDALAAYNRVLVLGRRTDPLVYDVAKEKLGFTQKKILEKFAIQMEEANGAFSTQDFSKAVKILDGILKAYPNHQEAKVLRAKAMEELSLQIKKIYQEAIVVESVGDLDDAVEKYQQILKLAPEDHEYYKKALEKIKKYN